MTSRGFFHFKDGTLLLELFNDKLYYARYLDTHFPTLLIFITDHGTCSLGQRHPILFFLESIGAQLTFLKKLPDPQTTHLKIWISGSSLAPPRSTHDFNDSDDFFDNIPDHLPWNLYLLHDKSGDSIIYCETFLSTKRMLSVIPSNVS